MQKVILTEADGDDTAVETLAGLEASFDQYDAKKATLTSEVAELQASLSGAETDDAQEILDQVKKLEQQLAGVVRKIGRLDKQHAGVLARFGGNQARLTAAKGRFLAKR